MAAPPQGPAPAAKLTPMMRQYAALRRSLPADALLLYHLGDFYELFFEDAAAAAPILGIALTRRGGAPMCGIPRHAAAAYLPKLLRAGRRVAIADQIGPARPGHLVPREIIRILSAGSLDDLDLLESRAPNHLAAIALHAPRAGIATYGLAWLDLSTGDFRCCELTSQAALRDELARIAPVETLHPDAEDPVASLANLLDPRHSPQPHDAYAWDPTAARAALLDRFGLQTLAPLDLEERPAAATACGAALHYASAALRSAPAHLRPPRLAPPTDAASIDDATQRNLELVDSPSGPQHALLHALDRTVTAAGARLLRAWLLRPLLDSRAIRARHQTVAALHADPTARDDFRTALKSIRDIPRLLARLSSRSGNPRDLRSLAASLLALPSIIKTLHPLASRAPRIATLAPRIHPLPDLAARLDTSLADSPPARLSDGGVIADGADSALDDLRAAGRDGRQWIADLQAREIERTGIKSLKIRSNAVFGYFIEITKANLDRAPADYTRRQTTANAERFVTAELKETEERIRGADARALALEERLFGELRAAAIAEIPALQASADALAELDALAGFAELATERRHVQPEITDEPLLDIEAGRHPVLEQTLISERFVPNDLHMGADARLLLITGPNMAGKSTYIRQAALIALMAQIGAFVPAAAARVGVFDQLFSRIGAGDDLARGRSTFLVEMEETARILRTATERSLVILDEIGRGTSTRDGLAIAWAVAERLHEETQARCLFATHYHELAALGRDLPAAANLRACAREWDGKLILLHKIEPGAADKSYGIAAARLAGVPAPVLDRAKDILDDLDRGRPPRPIASSAPAPTPRARETPRHPGQMTLDL